MHQEIEKYRYWFIDIVPLGRELSSTGAGDKPQYHLFSKEDLNLELKHGRFMNEPP